MAEKKVLRGILIFICVVLMLRFLYPHVSAQTKIVTVKKLDREVHNGKEEYIVYTEHHGVFKNVDCWQWSKFNSSDVQGILEINKKFVITYYGLRLPYYSEYPNIVEAIKIEK